MSDETMITFLLIFCVLLSLRVGYLANRIKILEHTVKWMMRLEKLNED